MMIRVKAGSLLYALCIALILSVLSGSLILLAFNTRTLVERDFAYQRLFSNVSSALNYYLTNNEQWQGNTQKEIDLFDSGSDSVNIRQRKWGLFDIVACTAHNGRINSFGAFLIADKKPKKVTALYLTDQNKPVAICGKTIIKGNSYLPQQGIKRAYIEGQNFIGSKLLDGVAVNSASVLPALKNTDEINSLTKDLFSEDDTAILIEYLVADKHLSNSFQNKTIVLVSTTDVELDNYNLEGNIIIKCAGKIQVMSSSNLSDIILIAKAVTFQKGFNGNLQAFADDSILVGEEVQLNYPSSVCILPNQKNDSKSKIDLLRNCHVKGNVVNFNNPDFQNRTIGLRIDENAEVIGLVYSPGYVNFKGAVLGSLFCGGFILKTPSAVYENHLLNAVINSDELPNYYVGSFPGSTGNKKALLKRLL